MTKLTKLGLTIALTSICTVSFAAAASCSSYAAIGSEKGSVIEALGDNPPDLSYINACIPKCTASMSDDPASIAAAQKCISGLNNVAYAVEYITSLKPKPSPNEFCNNPSKCQAGGGSGLGSALGRGFGAPAPAPKPYQAPTSNFKSYGHGYKNRNPVSNSKTYINDSTDLNSKPKSTNESSTSWWK